MLSDWMRLSRLARTRFSYPAYECTTYHSPGSVRSSARNAATGSASGSACSPPAPASPCETACSSSAGSPSGPPTWCCDSDTIALPFASFSAVSRAVPALRPGASRAWAPAGVVPAPVPRRPRAGDHAAAACPGPLAAPASAEDGDHQLREAEVEAGHDGHHDQDEDDRHRCVGDQLLARRPDHLPQLSPHLAQEDDRPGPARTRRRPGRPALSLAAYLSRHVLTYRADRRPALGPGAAGGCRPGFAGQEGLEPPTAGFGDRNSSQLSYCPVLSGAVHGGPAAPRRTR